MRMAMGLFTVRLSPANIVLDSNLESAKLVGLTRSALRNAISDSPLDAKHDIDAFVAFAKRLLPGSTGDRDKGVELFDGMTRSVELASHDLQASLVAIEQYQQSISDDEVSGGQTKSTGGSGPEETQSREGESESSVDVDRCEVSGQIVQTESAGLLERVAKSHPVILISSCVLVSAALIGSTVFAAKGLVAPAEVARTSPVVSEDEFESTSASSEISAPQIEKADSDSLVVSRPSITSTSRRPSALGPRSLQKKAQDTPKLGSMTDPAVNKAAIAALFNKDSKDQSVDASDSGNAIAESAGHSTSIPVQTVTVAPVVAAEKLEPEVNRVGASLSESKKIEYLNPGADPFKGFATSVDLSTVDNLEPISFGKLILEKKHLLGAEILCTDAIHRTKPIFELSRSAEDRQTWDINYRKKRKSPPVCIAKLVKKPHELFFNWTEAARDVKVASLLRNCRLRIFTATNSHWLSLREPIGIEGFRFTDSGSLEKEVQIHDLPILSSLSATADTIKVKANSTSRKYGSLMYPAEITPGFPARMFFEEDVDRFLSIDIAADIRKNLSLKAALVLQPLPNEPGFALDPGKTSAAMARVRELAIMAQQDYERAKAANLSTEEKKVFSDAAKALKGRAELTDYYEHIVPQLVGKDIPVTVTFSLNEQHRVVLAQTVNPEDENGK